MAVKTLTITHQEVLSSVLRVNFSWAKRVDNQPSQPDLNYALG